MPEFSINSESHSRSAQLVLDEDDVIAFVKEGCEGFASALRDVVGRGLSDFVEELKKREGGEQEEMEGNYLTLAKHIFREFKAETKKADSHFRQHRDRLKNVTVVAGNMGFCGSIPCFRFRVHFNRANASTWVNVFFQLPPPEHEVEEHAH